MNTAPNTGWNAFIKGTLLAAVTLLAGCGALSPPLDLTHLFGPSAHEEAIQRQAAADPFPDAKQAGL